MALLDVPITLRADYRIEVMSTSVLGGRYLDIQEGTSAAAKMSTDRPLKGSAFAEP